MLDAYSFDIVRAVEVQPPRFYIPARGRSEEALDVAARFSVNYARIEIDEQPGTGWPVNIKTVYCPCRYHAKMDSCVHRLFALRVRNYLDGTGERLMFNRSRKRGDEDVSNKRGPG
ncbi:hypothetical protein GN244_ATG01797 [Phytophthora infestans]|uniref:SWIM-type domain-containing protein n=1 Tax=Phytophthora infestans TaxID=4787 RepID=A0A833T3I6_PHYIN|nr:hypothetical protein GN244_ATG01797 [Phytophthora infestans]